jgi:uncharacterized protein (DUF849 family)
MKSEHDAVPVTSSEIASDARLVADAGAGAVHFHPRAHDGRETLDARSCGEAVSLARATCPGLPIGLSTAKWIENNQAKRFEAVSRWEVLPDFASVNFNEGGYRALCGLLLKRGIGVEAGVWSIEDAVRLVKSGLHSRCLRILVEVTEKEPRRAVSLAEGIEAYLERSGVETPRLHHAYGRAAWPVLENAILTGKDVRVGMEDTLSLADGTRANSNKQLIEGAVQLARRSGREPLRP